MQAEKARQEATRLDEAARNHMRAVRRHRRLAQEARKQLAALISEADRRGIHITINRQAPGGPSEQDADQAEA